MKDNNKSFSAVGPAAIRAVEMYYPEQKQLFYDPISIHFLPSIWKPIIKAMKFSFFRKFIMGLRERQYPGIVGNLVCRTRYIDDAFKEAVSKGAKQVLILGAGFDSRPYRISGVEKLSVFEVDHPQTQKQKKERLLNKYQELPAHVDFVPIDFNKQSLTEVMADTSFQPDLKTFVIWEGVTQYITEEAVDSVLDYVTGFSAESEVIFTYIKEEIIKGSDCTELEEKVVSFAEDNGVPWIFGINQDRIEDFLKSRGLELIEDVGADDYQERYLESISRSLDVFTGERITLAKVNG